MPALSDLERFLHVGDSLPMLIKIGLAHAQFETIHPFLDGNGRVGRLLITFLLTKHRILAKPVLYLSHHLKRHRQEYYERLQAIRDDGDWESWLAFFLAGVEQVSEEATETARRILALREQHRASITRELSGGAANGLRLLESLYACPILSVHDAMQATGTTFPTANKLVSRFSELGLLVEITGNQRNRRFSYDPYIQLFNVHRPPA